MKQPRNPIIPQVKVRTNPDVQAKFDAYPHSVKSKLTYLRKLILQTASEIDSIREIEETLKWGEPSYLAKKDSTLRIDWKPKSPDQYAMYFKCTSKLIPTFKEVFGDKFKYENDRAILFNLKEMIPEQELKLCIGCALRYHELKKLPLLGL